MIIIRKYKESDREVLKEITAICFEGVSLEYHTEQMFGVIHGKDWRWRKKRHVDADIDANADGIFVAEEEGEVVGYISTRVDPETKIGGIPNFSVLPRCQKKGIGRRLVDAAVEYLKSQGMEYARIETLANNEVGLRFYPRLGFQEVIRQVHYIKRLGEEGKME
ncbi:MAG: GNAT family N-acetyltransferase [Planctomycetota bacterium]